MLQSLSALGLNASSSTNRAMHDFVTKLALLSKMLGSVSYAICPHPSRIMTGSASKAEKVPNFTKSTFPKKGVGKFSKKKYISGITKASAFEWYASLVLSPPTPSNEPCDQRVSGQTPFRPTSASQVSHHSARPARLGSDTIPPDQRVSGQSVTAGAHIVLFAVGEIQ